MDYKLSRACKDCKNIDFYEVTKEQAAFQLYDLKQIQDTECTICKSKSSELLGLPQVKLDIELLDKWGGDKNLCLMPQDEQLLLGNLDYFDMVLNAIDENKYLNSKIDILIEAICVLLYDNSANQEEYSEQENRERELIAQKVRPELFKRKERIIAAEDWVMDYIKKVVYPQIGII